MPKATRVKVSKKNVLSNEQRFPNELLFEIYENLPFDGKKKFKFLNKEFYNYHKNCVKKMKNYWNPKNHFFYRGYDHKRVEQFEFVDVKNTSKKVKVVFHKKHSTCDDCILLRNERCKKED